jgi:hydroxymethylpyrimidine pyrophosphatase-like HAD family hydrolase
MNGPAHIERLDKCESSLGWGDEKLLYLTIGTTRHGMQTMLATGKAYGPWVDTAIPQLPKSGLPNIFMQGGLVYSPHGEIISDIRLDNALIAKCASFAKDIGVTLVAYCGNRIVTESTDVHTDRLIFYGEPTPEGVHQTGDSYHLNASEGLMQSRIVDR